jgi:hypothetical protein
MQQQVRTGKVKADTAEEGDDGDGDDDRDKASGRNETMERNAAGRGQRTTNLEKTEKVGFEFH